MSTQLRLGQWARADGNVGLVVALDEGTVTLFDPGERQVAAFDAADVEPVPAGGVTVTTTVELPLGHGVEESTLRRWLAALTDEVLRERAHQALVEAGVDYGAALPKVHVAVAPLASGAVCLCGKKLPAPPGTMLECPACGREAVSAPARSSDLRQ